MNRNFITIVHVFIDFISPPKKSIEPCKTITKHKPDVNMGFREWRQYIATEASHAEHNNQIKEVTDESAIFLRQLSKVILSSGVI